MTHEVLKAVTRRSLDPRFATRFLVGDGIDIGAGDDCLWNYRDAFPNMTSCKGWDLEDGDAQFMKGVPDNHYDFVHSSHCLEHLWDPNESLKNWIRILKPGGHLVILVPDEDTYEQGVWPSNFNGDHKTTWTTYKKESWSPNSNNIFDGLAFFANIAYPIKVELIDHKFDYSRERFDQTDERLDPNAFSESSIEFVLRKKTQKEIDQKGLYPK